MTTYAINGLGRMGKLLLRPLLEKGAHISFINDAVGNPEIYAHLLEFDSVHGRWPAEFSHDSESVTINGTRIAAMTTRDLTELPLGGVDVVIDCTGAFKTVEKLSPYFDAGVKKVVISAPVKEEEAVNIVFGVNHDAYDPARHRIVTASSCTTNCLAPVVKVVHENLGIRHGSMTTIHDVTNTQTIVDPSNSLVDPAVSCLGGEGVGLVYAELGMLSSSASLRHRPCSDIMLLAAGDATVFNESTHRMRIESSPDIEPLGLGKYGIAWVGTSATEYRPYYNQVSCCELRGDVDHSGAWDISDLTYFVDYLFGGGPAAPCEDESDIDYSGGIDISDLTYFVAFLFGGGPSPGDCW